MTKVNPLKASMPVSVVTRHIKQKKSLLGLVRNNHRSRVKTIYKAEESETDPLEQNQTIMAEIAEEQDFIEAAEELELVSSMKNTTDLNSSILIPNDEEGEKTSETTKVLSTTGHSMTGEFIGRNQVPLCSPAAKLLTESQKKDTDS